MKKIEKLKAFVLNKIDYSNTSYILSLYTDEYGRIDAIAKGAKKNINKYGNSLDVLNNVELVVYYKPETLSLITESSLINYYLNIKSNLKKLSIAYRVVELYYHQFKHSEKNHKLYLFLDRVLNSLENNKYKDDNLLFIKFLLAFIKEVGFEMQISFCNKCNSEIQNDAYFSFTDGIICKNCVNLTNEYFNFNFELNILKKCINSSDYILNEAENNTIVNFLEKYFKYHLIDFNGFNKIIT